MLNRKTFTIFALILVAATLIKAAKNIISPLPPIGYFEGVIPLVISLILIITLGLSINQKYWRLGCLMLAFSELLIYTGRIVPSKLGILIYSMNFPIIIIGAISIGLFYKSDFEFPGHKKQSLLPAVIVLILIISIFLVFAYQK